MERVQQEQRAQLWGQDPRPVVVITPTYVRTFQTLHLTGLMHTLMLVPYDLTWIVVEAGGISNETADLIERSKIKTIHLGFERGMPLKWPDRHKMEALMRIQALRVVKERKLDGIVVFADDSNMHSLELFDEIQKVKWIGALSVGILAHSGNSEPLVQNEKKSEEDKENMPLPIQGPACNSSNQLVGWHTFNSLPFMENIATTVGDVGTVLPTKIEWAGFVLNSKLVWGEDEGKPEWVRDLDSVGLNGEEIESPLALLKEASGVEPLGSCGKKVMLWWLRVEARADSKFPPGWIINPPLDITVPAKRTPWPDAPPQLPSEKLPIDQDPAEKHPSKSGRSRSRHSSRSKRKHEQRAGNAQITGATP
ncbi:uncharacterized protein A4U43_C05F32280 [Asparagus officinalis]|uniref:Glycosyltransferases n=1 Tax=Asparagus officinalis TaxID=4686 RepID=A0A5P1EYM7_ASPOF|nr:probable glucuronosyltransferase Os06g0687900 [Asparagus officinalis]ONK70297.1 uncharacterized protein A4U43_C05F32280 [Asparagus officinalis]